MHHTIFLHSGHLIFLLMIPTPDAKPHALPYLSPPPRTQDTQALPPDSP